MKYKKSIKFVIKSTSKYGDGVFATENISKGDVIYEFGGQEISDVLCDAMIAEGVLNNDDPLQIANDKYIILDTISRAFNHSCNPNSGLRKIGTLFAIKNIKKGEEITYDYSTTVEPNNFTFTTMTDCLCGSKKCRKVLGNVLSIPKDTLQNYIRMGALQDYIVRDLQEIGKYNV